MSSKRSNNILLRVACLLSLLGYPIVPKPATWAMQIGGYQPLEKWLKDRKGRALSFEDIQHYTRVIIALRETRRVMAEIDEVIPGWPLG